MKLWKHRNYFVKSRSVKLSEDLNETLLQPSRSNVWKITRVPTEEPEV